ncbi:putative membrane protein DUF2157 [Tamilnaduibacter salinus]|uniref:Putative membrane protein DUF2157 n=1 Tax=Tamilnaduibacter salinus TaxID=1484056 RepID=A0A2U1CW75_9GAMM|nr:DUF2157 domain-containing protein [Tamilnaduibacter salinus]PVY76255.1 putative membrane protein DUF2157 [Tamilnaduibacter salinus]
MSQGDRRRLASLIDANAIDAGRIDRALAVIGIPPTGAEWVRFLDRCLLWLGVLALSVAAVFFIAYNWDGMGRTGRFALLEGGLVVVIATYWTQARKPRVAAALLAMACLLVGALLALFGQTYQTGADPWQLFALWAAVIIPWVAVARNAGLWLFWVGLLNLSVGLYYESGGGWLFGDWGRIIAAQWAQFLLNVAVLVLWEGGLMVTRRGARWPTCVVAVFAGVPATWLAVMGVLSLDQGWDGIVAWALWMTLCLVFYRWVRLDRFMLAGFCLSGIVVITTAFGRWVLQDTASGGFLVLALFVLIAGAGSATWLKALNREVEA